MPLNNEFKIKNDSNTLGRILSSGTEITNIFTTNSLLNTLTGSLLPTTIYGNASGNWQSTYLTVSALSASWGQGGTNLAAVTNYLSTNNVLISGLRVTDNLTVVGSISTLNNGTSQQWNSTYTTVCANSGNWNTAYSTATTYQQASGGFALSGYNTTIADSVSSILVGGASPQAASVWKNKSIIQVLDTILFPDLTASYTIPTISITPTPATTQYEVGEIIHVSFLCSFTRNDAGGLSAIYIQRNPNTTYSTLSTTTNPTSGIATNVPDQFGYLNPNTGTNNSVYTQTFVDAAYTVIDAATNWRAVGDYRSGLPKRNNKGVVDTRPYGTRSIFNPQLSSTGFTSTQVTITGRRKLFYSNDTETSAPTNSTQVRALTGVIGSGSTWPANGTTFTIPVCAGSKRIVFAYPVTFDVVSDIKNGLGFDVKGDFVQSSVSVNGANSTLPTNYYVYTYIAPGTFASPETYSITV